MPDPVIIVGGGLAGLACAGELQKRGVPYRLFEASDRVGGRVRTDVVEGFRLDRGFQVHFPAYPNAARALEGAELDLRPWRNGAHVWDGARLRTIDRDRPLVTLRHGALPMGDLVRLLALSAKAASQSVPAIRALPDTSTDADLKRRGFSETAFRRFLRPFYGGVFVDPGLALSRRQFLFVVKTLGEKPASLPNAGMEAIPLALAARLDAERVHPETRVDEILKRSDGGVDGVRIGGERFAAASVVLATDADVAARLSDLPLSRGWLASVAVYFESEAPACEGAYIVLNGTGKGRVNEVAPLTNAAPGYAPEGRHLLCAVVLGDPEESDAGLIESVREETLAMCPVARSLRFLRLDRIRHHQLPQAPGDFASPRSTLPGLILAGETMTNCSIDGAIESGFRAAEAVAL